MTTNTSTFEKSLQQHFKYVNMFMLAMWRLGLGSWVNACPPVIGRIMVIAHTGRKSGKKRQTPVNYAIVEGDVYCVAGFGKASDWYRNIIANPTVDIWLPDSWWAGEVEEVMDTSSRIDLIRQVMIASGFAAFAAGLNPYKMTDEELGHATASYRLMRIRRTAARTGAGGPGNLTWVWPLATTILLPLALMRRRGKEASPDNSSG